MNTQLTVRRNGRAIDALSCPLLPNPQERRGSPFLTTKNKTTQSYLRMLIAVASEICLCGVVRKGGALGESARWAGAGLMRAWEGDADC